MESGVEMERIGEELRRPFQVGEVRYKPQSVKGNRALAMFYIDCRVVQDRLDEVIGVGNWQDEYSIVPDGSVVCQLRLRIGGEWVTKTDVGSPSEQPDGGDRLKAAFSDALKRAAVKFGIGRYLYRLPAVWCDYDPQKKQFSGTPQLPAWAIPKGKQQQQASPQTQPAAQQKPAKPAPESKLPGSGPELHRRLREYDAKLAEQKKCGLGAMLSHVSAAGVKAGFGDDITKWSGPAIQFAVDAVKSFEAGLKPKIPATLRDLWVNMGGGQPTNGVELLAWLASTDESLIRLLAGEYTPGGLAAHVVGFCKRKQPADLAELPAQDIGPAWNSAKQYVKGLETPAAAGVKA